MSRLFGTDGIRGIANTELTPELAFKLGRASAFILTTKKDYTPKIIIGMDTRASGDLLESAYTAGACSVGADVVIAGIIPTPAIPILIRKYNCDAGVIISASHNPCADNGIKLFDNKGFKLPDELEDEIESIILNEDELQKLPRPIGIKVGRKIELDEALDDYISALKSTLTLDNSNLQGLKIAIDCANGATYKAAPIVLFELEADVCVIHNEPNGGNINDNCGSTHMESLAEYVKETEADIGLAFDGDGDRLLAIDENGVIVNGDQIMSICGNYLKDNGKLSKNTIVGTIMSNLGFFLMGEKFGINIEKTKVGDRYVLEEILKNGYSFGGEQSGHIIFLDYNTTGDGILTALQLLQIMKKTGKPLSELNTYMELLPQALVNAKVANNKKELYSQNKEIMSVIKETEAALNGKGRVLIRPSGTEPCVRVMIEGPVYEDIFASAKKIAKLLEEEYSI